MDTVVLLHGLWMTGFETRVLELRLKRAGLSTCRFRYPTIRRGPREAAADLTRFIEHEIDHSGRVHFVAHSLGGIVLMHYFSAHEPASDSRVVLLGSPLRGSEVARQAAASPLGRFLLGHSLDKGGLLDGLPAQWPWQAQLGVIAGVGGTFGFGQMLGRRMAGPGDGTVALSETLIDGATDRMELSVSHLEMLVNPEVAHQVEHFIAHGRFSPNG